jgi:thiamine-phosphate pyrophosphorylase
MKIDEKLLRVIDANINRYKEGLRVVEDICRYIFNNKKISSQLKTLRHISLPITSKELLSKRDSLNDVLKVSTNDEKQRKDLDSLLTANIKRAQESARVLEEVFKLIDIQTSELFKTYRYSLYEIEKQLFKQKED